MYAQAPEGADSIDVYTGGLYKASDFHHEGF